VVRLPSHNDELVDRRTEGANLLALTSHSGVNSIMPRYYAYIVGGRNLLRAEHRTYEVADGTIVMSFVQGRELDGQLLRDERVQRSLVQAMHTLHNSGVRLKDYDIFRDEIEWYRAQAERQATESGEDKLVEILSSTDRDLLLSIEESLKRRLPHTKGVPSHNDLIFQNILVTAAGETLLLDFEYSGHNQRDGVAYDFGVLFGGNLFEENLSITTDTFENILHWARSLYSTPIDSDSVYLGAIANILVMCWWGALQFLTAESSNERGDMGRYTQDRVRRIGGLYNDLA